MHSWDDIITEIASGEAEAIVADTDSAPTDNKASWAEQDLVLRDLWGRGDTPEAISKVLQRSVAAIMTRAARLGLPRRFAPGRKARPRMPDGSPQPVKKPAKILDQAELSAAARPGQAPRVCLMCLNKFMSQGAHNRICPACKDGAEYAAAARLPELDFPV